MGCRSSTPRRACPLASIPLSASLARPSFICSLVAGACARFPGHPSRRVEAAPAMMARVELKCDIQRGSLCAALFLPGSLSCGACPVHDVAAGQICMRLVHANPLHREYPDLGFPSPPFCSTATGGGGGVDVWVPCLAKRLPSIGPRRPCVIRLRLDADRTNSGRPCTCTASRSVLICFIFFSKILIHEMGSGDELL